MVSSGAQPPSDLVEGAANNTTYHSASAVIGFIEAISVQGLPTKQASASFLLYSDGWRMHWCVNIRKNVNVTG